MTAKTISHLEVLPASQIPVVGMSLFHSVILNAVELGQRVAAFYGISEAEQSGSIRLVAILADDKAGELSILATEHEERYPALSSGCPQVERFEREAAEQWGITPIGHPWFKPVRFHHSYRTGYDAWKRSADKKILPSVMDFFRIKGEGIHEVAVGPVHAGIIEPGHFRFQCHGEQVLHLEISLGYQHRGIERALIGGPHPRTLHHMETLAGDTTIGHTMAYCRAIEAFCGCPAPERAQALRAVALELERLANHTGDLGALAADIGYLPTSSYCGRLRGDFLNLSAMLCGSRFGRGLVRPGGVAFDVDTALTDEILRRLDEIYRDVAGAVDLLWVTPSVSARFENTGVVSKALAKELGMVGPAARASGIDLDVRRDFPGDDAFLDEWVPVVQESGDVFARAFVRWLEIERSVDFIRRWLKELPGGPIRVPCVDLSKNSVVVSMTEGWRGEIVHVAHTDSTGRLARYKVVDPSFHNWMGLAMAMRGQEISDFPLCNKSFNLSYCGHDL